MGPEREDGSHTPINKHFYKTVLVVGHKKINRTRLLPLEKKVRSQQGEQIKTKVSMRKTTRSLFHGVAIECWGGLLQGEDKTEKDISCGQIWRIFLE